MAFYVCNAFSINMLASALMEDAGDDVTITVRRAGGDPKNWITEEETHGPGKAISAVGHADTAAIFSAILGRELAAARTTLMITPEDVLLVGQYSGPRLPEGATELPANAEVRWFWVTVEV